MRNLKLLHSLTDRIDLHGMKWNNYWNGWTFITSYIYLFAAFIYTYKFAFVYQVALGRYRMTAECNIYLAGLHMFILFLSGRGVHTLNAYTYAFIHIYIYLLLMRVLSFINSSQFIHHMYILKLSTYDILYIFDYV